MFEQGMTDQSARLDTSAFMQYPIAYYGATALMTGNSDIAWEFLKLQDDIITRPPSTHYNQALTYKTDGKPWGLPYYMTATVSWLFLDAIAGAVPDVSKQTLHLNPQMLPGEQTLKTPVFLTTSWFMVDYMKQSGELKLSIKPLRQFSPFPITKLIFSLPAGFAAVDVFFNGMKADCANTDNRLEIPVSFDPGKDSIEITVRN